MPTNRTRRRRVQRYELTATATAYLRDEEMPADHDLLELFKLQAPSMAEAYLHPNGEDLWRQYGAAILAEHVAKYPGTRPARWWDFDAPRSAMHPKQCELRRRLGGVGTPQHECLATYLEPSFGVPRSWVSQWQADYYNGRARHIQGQPIAPEYREGHFPHLAPDPADPPMFESEASYLECHGLLLKGERTRLTAEDFTPVSLFDIFDFGEDDG
jgi:hypothetical protein